MNCQLKAVLFSCSLAIPLACSAQQAIDVTPKCVDSIPKKDAAPAVASAVGTVVGMITAGVAGGDVTVVTMAAWLGCEYGNLWGKAYQKAYEKDPKKASIALMLGNNVFLLVAIGDNPQVKQAFVYFAGLAKKPDQPPGQKPDVIQVAAGGVHDAFILPLEDKALQNLGVSQADRNNILVLAKPTVTPKDVKDKANTLLKVVGVKGIKL